VDCSKPDPGRVTLRRLNRTEYNNTIRDLVGVDFQPADDFPADDSGYGFDNIGDVLSMPPVLLEKYLSAAEKILKQAMVTDFTTNSTRRFTAAGLEGSAPGENVGTNARMLSREGDIFTVFTFPVAGSYQLRARAYGQQAGPDPARMTFSVDGKVLQTFDVKAVESAPQIYEITVPIEAGKRKFSAAYINNYVNQNDPNPNNRDRNLIIEHLEIAGAPLAVAPVLPETHRRIFRCQPLPGKESECARQILTDFARRAYRRPVTSAEINRLLQFVTLAKSEGESFEKGIKLALATILISPHFLFRGELQPEPDNPQAVHPVNEYALASRLSYFLWSTMPDEELFRLAERKSLRKNIEKQVHRMLKDPKAAALAQNFSGQWLQTRNLKLVTPDPWLFPEFDEELRVAMEKETQLLFETIVKEDRRVTEFIDANYTFLNERLAAHYGIPGIKGTQFQRVSLNSSQRGGILTHGSFLTITSNPTRTSPVKRGKWVLENILGTPPPPPPPEVPELSEAKEVVLSGTLRQRMEQHREDPNCATCHARMDPIGFGFENYNSIGGWRNQDGKFAIDPAGKLVSGESFSGPADLKTVLLKHKQAEFLRCLSEKMLTYALGRGVEYFDKCAVDQIARGLERNQNRFSALIMEIVKSVPFQMRRGETAPMAQTKRTDSN
jgi:hypothetical protein